MTLQIYDQYGRLKTFNTSNARGGLHFYMRWAGDSSVGSTSYSNGDKYPYDSGVSTPLALDGGMYLVRLNVPRGFANAGYNLVACIGGSVSGSGDSKRLVGGTVIAQTGNEGIGVSGGAVGYTVTELFDSSSWSGIQTIFLCAQAWGGGSKSPTLYASVTRALLEFIQV